MPNVWSVTLPYNSPLMKFAILPKKIPIGDTRQIMSVKSKKNLGLSVSCDGVCLTLISCKKKIIEFYLSNETLKKSKFRNVKINDKINLELPLKFGQNISGHICQGHVDTVSKVKNIKRVDKSLVFEFKISKNFKKLLVQKASILINGVSLTISKIKKEIFNSLVSYGNNAGDLKETIEFILSRNK